MKLLLRRFRLASLCAALVSLAASASAQTNTVSLRPLSLQECIQLALQHNLDVQIERYNPIIAAHTLGMSYGTYDPVLTMHGEHDKTLAPGGFDVKTGRYPGSETDTTALSSGVNGLLPWGLSYNLGVSLSDSYGNRPFTGPNGEVINNPFESTYGNAGALQLRQPLLKNFWIDTTRMNIAINKKSLKISELTLRQQVMATVTAVEQAYYDLVLARETLKVQEQALQLAQRSLEENAKRVAVGAMAPLDEKQAQSQVAARRADLLQTQRVLAGQQNVLKGLLSDDFKQWQNVVVEPTDTLSTAAPRLNVMESWRKGLTQRPDFLQAKLTLERQDILLRYDRNQLLPQLDLIGSYGYQASEKEFSGALNALGQGDSPFYTYGATLSFPLSNRSARENLKSSKVQKAQALLRLKKTEQDIMIEIDDAVAVAQSNFERVDATLQARQYAEAALEAEQKKLENGKSTSFVVLSLQRDLTSARSAEVQALADYNKALAQLALREGTTLERNRLEVEVK